MNISNENLIKNKNIYDEKYKNVNIQSILNKINNLKNFMADATQTDTSWVGLYYGNFETKLKNKKILELGCGDCTNAAVMAALGAEVYANDISSEPKKIIDKLNLNYNFKYKIKFIQGDFLKTKCTTNFYDFIIGKAFVHHLTNEQEIQFIKKIIQILKPNGTVRYFEPAVNNKILDKLRWLIPVPGRPSIIQRKKFKRWKLNDPHPIRDNSSNNYIKIGKKYFQKTKIIPIGSLERFYRLLPKKFNRPFRRFAFKIEKYIPKFLNLSFARSQLIEYKNPKK